MQICIIHYKQKNGGMNMQNLKALIRYNEFLSIYKKLVSGEIMAKGRGANNYGVNEESIQRDIDDIEVLWNQSRANRNYK